ncbi:hypothetical protein [Actinokineospora sp. NBRC 105648]|uniref:hypothetical protein n=1 Tax=Actinokineospora sp. NBRC 105648 TaxID=3032206 RepID=UPI0024A48AB9|nr:hypothetical protein [Actinokineospora sp. NBRC 105648]GLZ38349.1 hypothetical protein Acsp05_19730 [Actinokineospora sp. NBRC 105648]
MEHFVLATFSFPVVLFTFLLVVVAGYWVLVALRVSRVDALDPVAPEALGLGRVPLSVALSLATVIAWVVSLVGDLLVGDSARPVPVLALLHTAVLAAALLGALFGTRAALVPLGRLFRDDPAPALVGCPCVVRTGRVDRTFGQAEVTTRAGETVIVQVRQPDTRAIRTGSTATLGEYDRSGRFFWLTT